MPAKSPVPARGSSLHCSTGGCTSLVRMGTERVQNKPRYWPHADRFVCAAVHGTAVAPVVFVVYEADHARARRMGLRCLG